MSNNHSTSNCVLPYCFYALFLLFCVTFTACGSDAAPAAADLDKAAGKNTPAPPPSAGHLRAFDVVLDLDGENFSPIPAESVPRNSCSDLSVPTHITKVEDTWFIVDCYHNQVIYHDNLSDPLTEWQVLTSEIDKGHTIASDGLVYLVDDTEGNRILVFEKKEGVFYHTQTLDGVGNRPHYIIYDAPTDTFYVWSSMSGEMYLCRHDPGAPQMYLTEIRRMETLADTYVRSFTIDGGDIYFVSGTPGTPAILRADLSTFEIRETYPVPDSMAGMVQLTTAGESFYITVSTDIAGNQDAATMVRTEDLSQLTEGACEDVYANFIGGGTPYYITHIDSSYYLTEHRIPGHAVWKFDITENGISNVEAVY
ncbi:MAG: hypothetical protein K2O15_01780 [Lachnospiraceae bacterium]|nr:hypothetical protein [Lachnospiraceae bacterium]